MISFNISLGSDLHIIDHEIRAKRSTADSDNNAFEIRDNGLYLDNRLVADGEGFVNQQSGIIRIGFYGPYDIPTSGFRENASGRVSANNIIHRVYTAKDSSGTTFENFREVDSFIPGDMLRVPQGDGTYEYRLIIATTSTDDRTQNPQHTYGMNNEISETVVLGTW